MNKKKSNQVDAFIELLNLLFHEMKVDTYTEYVSNKDTVQFVIHGVKRFDKKNKRKK